MRYFEIISESSILDIEGVRYWQNPSRQQVIGLAAKHDLRGTTDGKNVFVWDANIMIHHNARYHLRHVGDFESIVVLPNGKTLATNNNSIPYYFNFYVSNRKVRARRGTKENWLKEDHSFLYILDENTRLAVLHRGKGPLEGIPAFARMIRGAEIVDADAA